MLPERFELSVSPLPRECSTPELRQRCPPGHDDYFDMGRRMAGLGLPSMVVMEDGYAVDDLGIDTVNFIKALAQGLVGIEVEVVLASIVERFRKMTPG